MTTATNEIILVSINQSGPTFAVNGENKSLTWDALREAATQSDDSLRSVYADLLRQASAALRELPRAGQGIVVKVHTRTGGATWIAEAYDASGSYRGDLMASDEGMDEPHHHLASKSASRIADRIGARVVECPLA